jgi:hypothetical protein
VVEAEAQLRLAQMVQAVVLAVVVKVKLWRILTQI